MGNVTTAPEAANIAGINIQWPWSRMIMNGLKTVETRTYPLPIDKTNIPLALIETPGPLGRKHGISNARIVGIVKFISCFEYKSESAWLHDFTRHQVSTASPFAFERGKRKYGWELKVIKKFDTSIAPPQSRGHIWARNCLSHF